MNGNREVDEKVFLPICYDVSGGGILVVGGGKVALQKLKTLVKFTREITVVSERTLPEIESMGVSIVRARYQPEHLAGARLVFACTDDRTVNATVAADARAAGIPACSADDPDSSDFISPAVHKNGAMSVAVSSGGEDVKRAVKWRDIIAALDARGDLP